MQPCRGYTSFGGWQLQRDLIRYNSLNRLATLVVMMLAFSGLVFLLLAPGRMVLRGVRMIAISLHSQLAADYSADLHAAVGPVGVSLIEEALDDRDNPIDVPGLIDALTTPVPLVTPMPTLPGGFFPTPGLFPTLPLPGATGTATLKPPTLTPTLFTPTLTNTAIFTPTFTPTGGIVITPVVPTVTHTPTRTPTMPTPPTHTPTRTPPTPPTSTFTQVPTSTFTPIPYPPPITDTPYPTATPVTPPPGETPPTPVPPTPTCSYPYC